MFCHFHRSRFTDMIQIVAFQIHNHQQFASVLFGLSQLLAQSLIFLSGFPPLSGPFHRPGLHLPSSDLQEAFRRGTDNLKITVIQISAKGRGIMRSQITENIIRIFPAVHKKPLSHVGYINISRADIFHHIINRPLILLLLKICLKRSQLSMTRGNGIILYFAASLCPFGQFPAGTLRILLYPSCRYINFLFQTIFYYQVIVKSEPRIGHLYILGMSSRNIFKFSPVIIGKISDGSCSQRKICGILLPVIFQISFQNHFHRFPCRRSILKALPVLFPDSQTGILSQDGIASPLPR